MKKIIFGLTMLFSINSFAAGTFSIDYSGSAKWLIKKKYNELETVTETGVAFAKFGSGLFDGGENTIPWKHLIILELQKKLSRYELSRDSSKYKLNLRHDDEELIAAETKEKLDSIIKYRALLNPESHGLKGTIGDVEYKYVSCEESGIINKVISCKALYSIHADYEFLN